MSGRSQIHPSPQRTPVLFQAGTSKTGAAFAAKHAEAIFLNPSTVSQAKKVIADARAAAAAIGRDPKRLKFFPCIVPIIGRTEEEAKEKYDLAVKNADIVGGLGQVSFLQPIFARLENCELSDYYLKVLRIRRNRHVPLPPR